MANPRASAYCFEPSPQTYEHLRTHVELNSMTTVDVIDTTEPSRQ